ncbi:hypothetical protein [Rhodospirillum centenum]|uniref:hypothetical protein n=1 Tax=Rhodospirillum centenum TaxID=34018 RepID=UPI00161EF27C|nr:hypothetical protein [Rhodospirillum centenum]
MAPQNTSVQIVELDDLDQVAGGAVPLVAAYFVKGFFAGAGTALAVLKIMK